MKKISSEKNMGHALLLIGAIVLFVTGFNSRICAELVEQNIEYLITMHKQNPRSVECIMEIGAKYKEQREYGQAVDWLKKAAALRPDDMNIPLQIGIITSWMGKYAKAIEFFDRIISNDPYHSDALLAKARVLSWQNKRVGALELCERVLKERPGYIDAYEIQARILMWNSEFKKAEDIYRRILDIAPDNLSAQMSMINMIAARGAYQSAVDKFRVLLKKHPDNTDLLRGLGRVQSWMGDYTGALKLFNMALEADPHDRETLESMARVYRWGKLYDDGIEAQKKIYGVDKTNIPAIIEIAMLYEAKGDDKEAIVWYEKALKLDRDNPQLNARLGLLYSRSSRIDDAITSLQMALTLQDNDVETLINLGRVYSWKLKIADAVGLFSEAIKIDPNNQDAYIGLGRAYFYNGDNTLARKQFEKALAINPFNREAKSELKKITNLSCPRYMTRLDIWTFRDNDPLPLTYDAHTGHREFLQSVEFRPGTKTNIGVQYRNISEKGFAGGVRDYGISADVLAVSVSRKFSEDIRADGKLGYGSYRDDGGVNYTMNNDKAATSGYLLTRYNAGKAAFTASLSRETLYPVFRGSLLEIKNTNSAGVSARFDLNENVSLLSYSFYRNYYNSYKRNDSAAGIQYVLPFLRECELAYTYRSLSGPGEALNKCSVSYRNEFDFLKYMITFSRETDSLYNTINKSALFTGHYNISDSVMLFADLSYDVVSMADDTSLFYGKIYTAYQF